MHAKRQKERALKNKEVVLAAGTDRERTIITVGSHICVESIECVALACNRRSRWCNPSRSPETLPTCV